MNESHVIYVYETYKTMVFSLTYAYLQNVIDSEDATLETFVRLMQSEYLLYKIDFASKPTISELVRISSLPPDTGPNDIRRAVLIEGVVYTFSSNNIATYDLSNNVLNNNALSF